MDKTCSSHFVGLASTSLRDSLTSLSVKFNAIKRQVLNKFYLRIINFIGYIKAMFVRVRNQRRRRVEEEEEEFLNFVYEFINDPTLHPHPISDRDLDYVQDLEDEMYFPPTQEDEIGYGYDREHFQVPKQLSAQETDTSASKAKDNCDESSLNALEPIQDEYEHSTNDLEAEQDEYEQPTSDPEAEQDEYERSIDDLEPEGDQLENSLNPQHYPSSRHSTSQDGFEDTESQEYELGNSSDFQLSRPPTSDRPVPNENEKIRSLINHIDQYDRTILPLPRDGDRTRYAPPDRHARIETDLLPKPLNIRTNQGRYAENDERQQSSLQEFLNVLNEGPPSFELTTATTKIKPKEKTPRFRSPFTTIASASKENVSIPRTSFASGASGSKDSPPKFPSPFSITGSASKNNVNTFTSPLSYDASTAKDNLDTPRSRVFSNASTSESKEKIKAIRPPPFATLRHKFSSIFIGEASRRDEKRDQISERVFTSTANLLNPSSQAEFPICNTYQDQGTQTVLSFHPTDNLLITKSSSIAAKPPALASSETDSSPRIKKISRKPVLPLETTPSAENVALSKTLVQNTQQGQSSRNFETPANKARSATRATPGTSEITRKPVPNLETTSSAMNALTPDPSSSVHGQLSSQSDPFGSHPMVERSTVRQGSKISSPIIAKRAHQNEAPTYTPRHPIIKEFEKAYLEEAFGVSSTRDLLATPQSKHATREPSSLANIPSKRRKAQGLNISNFISPLSALVHRSSREKKEAAQSPKELRSTKTPQCHQNISNMTSPVQESPCHKPDNKGSVRAIVESSSGNTTPRKNSPHPNSPLPEPPYRSNLGINRNPTEQSSENLTSHLQNFLNLPSSPSQSPYHNVDSNARTVRNPVEFSSGNHRQNIANLPSSPSESPHRTRDGTTGAESSASGAKGKDKEPRDSAEDPEAKAQMEQENFVAFKVQELRAQTGSQVQWRPAGDSRPKHPNHLRRWGSKNLWCTKHAGACACCGAPCCALAGATRVAEDERAPACEKEVAGALAQAITLYVPLGTDESTLMECTSCHQLVCPECCSLCPIVACSDRVCRGPGCNPDRQWEPCDWHE